MQKKVSTLQSAHAVSENFTNTLLPSSFFSTEGPVSVNTKPPPSFLELEAAFPMLQLGGRYHPPQCRAKQKLALILPYRDRRVHLKIFLRNMHQFLQKQQLDYAIFVIELVS